MVSERESNTRGAPSFSMTAARIGLGSTTPITFQPRATATASVAAPSVPPPRMRTSGKVPAYVGTMPRRCTPFARGSIITAALSDTESGIGMTFRAGTQTKSAIAPFTRSSPIRNQSAQTDCRPARHIGQCPQETSGFTETRVPTRC